MAPCTWSFSSKSSKLKDEAGCRMGIFSASPYAAATIAASSARRTNLDEYIAGFITDTRVRLLGLSRGQLSSSRMISVLFVELGAKQFSTRPSCKADAVSPIPGFGPPESANAPPNVAWQARGSEAGLYILLAAVSQFKYISIEYRVLFFEGLNTLQPENRLFLLQLRTEPELKPILDRLDSVPGNARHADPPLSVAVTTKIYTETCNCCAVVYPPPVPELTFHPLTPPTRPPLHCAQPCHRTCPWHRTVLSDCRPPGLAQPP